MAYTTGYGAVMPAYSQPMMSAVQMPHEDVTNQQSLDTHTDTCGDEYIGGVDTDYTGTDDYYAADNFVPVSDVLDSESPADDCLNEETPTDKLVGCHSSDIINSTYGFDGFSLMTGRMPS